MEGIPKSQMSDLGKPTTQLWETEKTREINI